ncbi:Alpha/Beta hydrolase protein, partial [Schizophyllum fasciatum]
DYVGYWAAHNTVIVGHEGTDPTRLLADLTDIRLLQGWLSPSLFPGAGLSPLVHVGFRDEHARTARTILAEVTALMGAANTTKVAVVGHSLGGALAELDAVYLALNLPRTLAAAGTEVGLNVSVRAVTFGKPRVGNAAWAALVDKHVNVVPIVPPRALNYLHPRGEVHLLGPGDAVACPGNDDADDPQCQIKSVPSVFNGSVMDHLGPYEGIMIGTTSCVGPA